MSLQVRLLKCLVDNIVVDISFNQLGGLCTLTFLEEMDRVIGPDHLFKKSIILVSRRDSRGGGRPCDLCCPVQHPCWDLTQI